MRKYIIKADKNLEKLISSAKYGKVHSVFENSFNIIFQNELINFNYKKDYIAQFGFNISFLPKMRLKQGQIALISDKKIIIYSDQEYEIKFEDIEFIDLSPVLIDKEGAKLFINQINEQEIYKKMGIEVDEKLISIVRNIDDINEMKNSLEYLIGKGMGLTPSGDDIICGYIFSNLILGKEFYLKYNIDYILNKTTDISKHHIKNINKGYLNSILKNLNTSIKNKDEKLISNSIKEILSYGHTSGADLIFGIIQCFKLYLKQI